MHWLKWKEPSFFFDQHVLEDAYHVLVLNETDNVTSMVNFQYGKKFPDFKSHTSKTPTKYKSCFQVLFASLLISESQLSTAKQIACCLLNSLFWQNIFPKLEYGKDVLQTALSHLTGSIAQQLGERAIRCYGKFYPAILKPYKHWKSSLSSIKDNTLWTINH